MNVIKIIIFTFFIIVTQCLIKVKNLIMSYKFIIFGQETIRFKCFIKTLFMIK